MTSNRLEWHDLQPDTERYTHFTPQPTESRSECFASVQPRLFDGLTLLMQTRARAPLMLIKSAEDAGHLDLLNEVITFLADTLQEDEKAHVYGGRYQIEQDTVSWVPSSRLQDNFTSEGGVHHAEWIEAEQLFGCLRINRTQPTLTPGLVHRANGGVLILPVRTLLAQPLLWVRLKKILTEQRFDWYSPDERQPLPFDIPSMPVSFRLVLSGDRDALADFQDIEPEMSQCAIYSEFEENIQLVDDEETYNWMRWVQCIANRLGYSSLDADFWPVLVREAARYTGERETLPLDLTWLSRQLHDAALNASSDAISGENLRDALSAREWREGFLSERVRDDILLDQVLIETEGEVTGQINALSVIEFPGHPRAFGEPSRISCVVHAGDGEFTDVERKAELGGNIHAKGMMIMQAWLTTELQLEQQLPFTASLVFEQSYSEIDGDSASLAELCALVSALASQPLYQHVAVTGSIDQFGNVQPVGGLNEKIEGFFHICNQRTLTGSQGVIIPSANVRHLSLHQDVIDAVREGKFHLWAVSSVDEALPLLTGVEWDKGDDEPSLLRAIQERITQFTQPDLPLRPWPLRWLNWFNHR